MDFFNRDFEEHIKISSSNPYYFFCYALGCTELVKREGFCYCDYHYHLLENIGKNKYNLRIKEIQRCLK